MAGVNKVILLGNLGADPEVKTLNSGAVVARLRLATSEKYRDKEGNLVDNTEWHEIELWDNLAKIAQQYLHKGDSVFIEGKLKTDTWQDEQGNNRKAVKIRGLSMNLIGGNRSNANGAASAPASAARPAPAAVNDAPVTSFVAESDDLPF